ncbi:ArsS family sensor histidine kinase [Sulfurimonas sp. HSL-1716]|uniref:ArsS family sensor histidine kinase n=1 Tax=Hydrocurvibacter sulfurireducens TaxID=3131937 RepID=UPI0031F7A0D8
MSIQKKITILFLSSLVTMSLIALWVERTNLQKARTIEQNSYLTSAKELFTPLVNKQESELNKRIEELGLQIITDGKIIKNAEIVFMQPHTFGVLKIIKYSQRYYLYIKYLDQELLLYDTAQDESRNERYITNSLVVLDVVLMVVIYLVILKILSPLKYISQKMRQFSKGNLFARSAVKTKDEIGDVSRSFNEMASRLEEMINAREELLRDVGHELRTPIAKGKFALEGVAESKEKEIIKRAFNDLDTLTSEILQMQLLNKEDLLEYGRFKAQTLIAEALSKLYIEDEDDIKVEIEDFEIEGDLHYLSTALKNLIDNALKYSTSKPVIIKAQKRKISICSSGEELDRELEHYLQAFTQQERLQKGFGIGLNIVSKIVQKHGFKLDYAYLEGKNIFTIVFVA